MTLKDAINDVMAFKGTMVFGPSLPDEPRIVKTERKLAAAYGVGELKAPPDLDEIAERLRNALLAGADLEITRRDLRFAPQCIWSGLHPIAEDSKLLTQLLKRIAATGRRALTRSLAAVYFRMYHLDRPGLEIVSRALQTLMTEQLGSLYELHQKYRVFEVKTGPETVAAACYSDGGEPYGFLLNYGFGPQSIVEGFGAAVFVRGMRRISEELARNPTEAKIALALRWVEAPGAQSFASANKILANTLLLPFAQRDPPEDFKTLILDALLERIGDPRTRSQNWTAMPEAAQIARRWLTRLALRQFLEIVDDVALKQQWEYRRAFWMAFYDKGFVEEAWVAFGPTGRMRVLREFGRNVSCGRLESSWKSVEHGHAVLIMRIGGFTVCDWSHNGRCIIWPTSSMSAPKLYLPVYQSGNLAPRLAPEGGIEQTHSSPSTYSWQRNVAEFLRRKAGVKITDRDFQVRRR
jgi:EH signature protein